MNAGRERPGREEAAGEDRRPTENRGSKPALPTWDCPLLAFRLGEGDSPETIVHLGGDLHAVHPDAADRDRRGGEDRTLETASISVHSPELFRGAEVEAEDALWLLALDDELASRQLLFLLHDSEGRRRAWLHLPSPDSMIGECRPWLPAVPSFPGEEPPAPTDLTDRRR